MRGKHEGNYIRFVARKRPNIGYDGEQGTPVGTFYVRTERVDKFGAKRVHRGGINPSRPSTQSTPAIQRLAKLLTAMGMPIELDENE